MNNPTQDANSAYSCIRTRARVARIMLRNTGLDIWSGSVLATAVYNSLMSGEW